MKKGKVWLVGAGPGDIGLFTLKGLKVLERADVVVYGFCRKFASNAEGSIQN